MTDTRSYYTRYWSDEGYAPRGEPVYSTLAAAFAAHIGPGSRCLDVGCGDGSKSGDWLTRRGASYLGVDISDTAVELARARGLDVRLISDAGALGVDAESVDVVICTEVFEHLFDTVGASQEIFRVLRPGGKVIVTVPNVAHWRNRADFALLGRWHPGGDDHSAQAPWRDPHIRFFTPSTLAAMLGEAGFQLLECRAYGDAMVLARLPVIGPRFVVGRPPGPLSRFAYRRAPAVFGSSVLAVARKPGR